MTDSGRFKSKVVSHKASSCSGYGSIQMTDSTDSPSTDSFHPLRGGIDESVESMVVTGTQTITTEHQAKCCKREGEPWPKSTN